MTDVLIVVFIGIGFVAALLRGSANAWGLVFLGVVFWLVRSHLAVFGWLLVVVCALALFVWLVILAEKVWPKR